MTFYAHPTAIVEEPVEIGEGTKIWHFAHVRKGAKIGRGCIIGKSAYVDSGVQIGDYVKIQNNVSIYHGVTVGDGVFLGPHVCFTNDRLPRAINADGTPKSADDWVVGEIRVGKGVSIGANATIVTGVTLGDWSMVGAGAVVTRSLPPHALAVGNPARVVGVVAQNGEIVARKYAPGTYLTRDGKHTVAIT